MSDFSVAQLGPAVDGWPVLYPSHSAFASGCIVARFWGVVLFKSRIVESDLNKSSVILPNRLFLSAIIAAGVLDISCGIVLEWHAPLLFICLVTA